MTIFAAICRIAYDLSLNSAAFGEIVVIQKVAAMPKSIEKPFLIIDYVKFQDSWYLSPLSMLNPNKMNQNHGIK